MSIINRQKKSRSARLNLSVNACEGSAAVAATPVVKLDASKNAARNSSPARSDKYFSDELESLTHTLYDTFTVTASALRETVWIEK